MGREVGRILGDLGEVKPFILILFWCIFNERKVEALEGWASLKETNGWEHTFEDCNWFLFLFHEINILIATVFCLSIPGAKGYDLSTTVDTLTTHLPLSLQTQSSPPVLSNRLHSITFFQESLLREECHLLLCNSMTNKFRKLNIDVELSFHLQSVL